MSEVNDADLGRVLGFWHQPNVVSRAFNLAVAAIVVGSLLFIGQYQANQYRGVVERLDRNAAISAQGTDAIVCVLQIRETDKDKIRRAIDDCLKANGFDPGRA